MEPDRKEASPTESAHRELSSGTLWSRIVEKFVGIVHCFIRLLRIHALNGLEINKRNFFYLIAGGTANKIKQSIAPKYIF